MANNRISIRCATCGGELVIAKRLGGGYYRANTFSVEALDTFLEEHEQCTLTPDSPVPPFYLSYEQPDEY